MGSAWPGVESFERVMHQTKIAVALHREEMTGSQAVFD